MKQYLLQIRDSILGENALYTHFLGLCPALIVTTCALWGLLFGIITTLVLTLSACILSALRRFVSPTYRLMTSLLVIGTLVVVLSLFLQAFWPSLYAKMGLMLPMVAASTLILGRIEGFALHHTIPEALCDRLGTGLGYALSLTFVGAIRELLGFGTVLGGTPFAMTVPIWAPVEIFLEPTGAFLILGFVAALARALRERKKQSVRKEEKP